MAKQKQKIYKENSLEEITVKKVMLACVCVCLWHYILLYYGPRVAILSIT